MLAMLSGVAFRNELPFREFLARHPSVFHALGQQGYQLRSLTSHGLDHPNPAFPGVDDATRYDRIRDRTGADLVHLIVDRDHGGSFDFCGVAWLPRVTLTSTDQDRGFGLTDYRCGGSTFRARAWPQHVAPS